jgi:hypothetical protein
MGRKEETKEERKKVEIKGQGKRQKGSGKRKR